MTLPLPRPQAHCPEAEMPPGGGRRAAGAGGTEQTSSWSRRKRKRPQEPLAPLGLVKECSLHSNGPEASRPLTQDVGRRFQCQSSQPLGTRSGARKVHVERSSGAGRGPHLARLLRLALGERLLQALLGAKNREDGLRGDPGADPSQGHAAAARPESQQGRLLQAEASRPRRTRVGSAAGRGLSEPLGTF